MVSLLVRASECSVPFKYATQQSVIFILVSSDDPVATTDLSI
jgi:hypothetical protein